MTGLRIWRLVATQARSGVGDVRDIELIDYAVEDDEGHRGELRVNVHGDAPGTFDVFTFKFTRDSFDSFVAAIAKRYGGGGP